MGRTSVFKRRESRGYLRITRTFQVMALQMGGTLSTRQPFMVRKSVTEAPQQCATELWLFQKSSERRSIR